MSLLQAAKDNTMRKMFLAISLLLFVGAVCAAQEVPKQEIYLGYSFVRVNAATSVPAFTANGGLGSFQYNFNDYVAAVAEVGGTHNGNISGVQLDSTFMTYLFGPRFTVNKARKVEYYVHGLFGASHYTRSILVTTVVNPQTGVSASGRAEGSADAFSMAWGGGIDLKLSRTIALRPIQLDYLMTRFQPLFMDGVGSANSNSNQHHIRYSTGLVFRF